MLKFMCDKNRERYQRAEEGITQFERRVYSGGSMAGKQNSLPSSTITGIS